MRHVRYYCVLIGLGSWLVVVLGRKCNEAWVVGAVCSAVAHLMWAALRRCGGAVAQAGALLAIGIVNAGVQNENDPAFALISEYVTHSDINIRTGEPLPCICTHPPARNAPRRCSPMM